MRNCIEYVLRVDKIEQEFVGVTGPFSAEVINYDNVYRAFIDEKKLWKKDSGRMYAHNVISWHKDEKINLREAFAFGMEFAEKWFRGFQTLVAVHKEREHLHLHLITNTVNYENGYKLHNSKKDMEKMKQFTNEMCRERGLSIAKKGKSFDGGDLEEGHVRAWSKDTYHLLQNETKDSFVADCALAVLEVKESSISKEEFIDGMKLRGWAVVWTDKRKHITFENEVGQKVRGTNISKTFNLEITKEALLNEFERQAEQSQSEYKYTSDKSTDQRTLQSDYGEANTRAEDTGAFLAKLRAEEGASAEKRDNQILKRTNREIERERQNINRKYTTNETKQGVDTKQRESASRNRKNDRSR